MVGWTDGALPGQTSAGLRDAFVRKFSAGGAHVWTRQFGTSNVDVAFDVAVGEAGSIYVAGQTGGTLPGQVWAGMRDAFVRKYDADGTELWTNVYVAGWVYGALPGQQWGGLHDAFVRKYSAAGQEVWTRQAGTPASDARRTGAQAHDIAVRLAVGGAGEVYTAGFADGNRIVARVYSATGAQLSGITLTPEDSGTRHVPTVDSTGNIYVIGTTGFDHGEAFVRKYDPTGKPVWTDMLGHSDMVTLSDVSIDQVGNVYVAGTMATSMDPNAGREAFVHRHAANATTANLSKLGTSVSDMTTRVRVDGTGAIVLVGWVSRPFAGQVISGPTDAFAVKIGAF